MKRSVVQRLKDVRRHAERAIHLAKGWEAEPKVGDVDFEATLFNFVVIGEAANAVPKDVRTLSPDIRWMDARGLRNMVVHEYWRIDGETIRKTAQNDLPTLVSQLDDLIVLVEERESRA